MHVVIVGAGIGGLAAALALARSGIAPPFSRRRRKLGEIGAGIQLGPNAFHVLDQLGMGEALLKGAVYVDAFGLMDSATGKQINRCSYGEDFRSASAILMSWCIAPTCINRCSMPATRQRAGGHQDRRENQKF